MAKKKLLDKLVKKDYNDNLEEVLSGKKFSEEVKNLLLDMMYKIEISYKDYETVKKNVLPKETYIENIINIVKNNCESIILIKPEEKQKKLFEIDKEKKKIVCYPMINNLLYCLIKIQKSDDIMDYETPILNKTFTDMINIGNNINMVEPLRDFNGYSWNISVYDIENFYYNLVYQSLIFLVGNTFVDEWTCMHSTMVDYSELFKEKIETVYGKKLSQEILKLLENISILLELHTNNLFREKVLTRRIETLKEIDAMQNKEKYVEDLSKQKRKLTKNIKDIDIMLNDKEQLSKEYEKRNKKLPLDKKIFSKRVLKLKLQEERNELVAKLQKCNDKMNSNNFLQAQKNLKNEQKYLDLVDEEDYEKKALQFLIMLQNRILSAFKIKIQQAKEKEEIIKIIYELRYYNLIPLDKINRMGKIPKINKLLQETENEAIEKAYELKVLNEVSKDKQINLEILKYIFSLNIINLEDIHIKILKERDNIFIQFYDDNIADEKIKFNFELNKEKMKKIRFNKKILLFI